MNDDIELVNAGEYLDKLYAYMCTSKLYYYDIQYMFSTTLLMKARTLATSVVR